MKLASACTHAERTVQGAMLLAAVALCTLVIPSSAAAVPFKKHGTLTVAKSGLQDPIKVTYRGRFPGMRSNEIVSYVLLFDEAVGSQPRNCNKYPPGSGSPQRRKHRRATFSVFVDADGGGDPPTRWCRGRWIAVAYVLRQRRDSFYAPRMMYAKKRFSIG